MAAGRFAGSRSTGEGYNDKPTARIGKYVYGRYEDGKFTEWELGKFIRVNAMYCLESRRIYNI
jgi:hypothetical protein